MKRYTHACSLPFEIGFVGQFIRHDVAYGDPFSHVVKTMLSVAYELAILETMCLSLDVWSNISVHCTVSMYTFQL